MEISNISIGKMITKCVANHSSKAYEFSHFLPYLDPMQSQHLIKREDKFILPKPFSYDDVSESEAQDQVELVFGIEDEFQSDLHLDLVPTPNPRPKWAQKVIKVDGNMVGDQSDISRTISQFQYENHALCHTYPLPPIKMLYSPREVLHDGGV